MDTSLNRIALKRRDIVQSELIVLSHGYPVLRRFPWGLGVGSIFSGPKAG
jgi:hypothetical protein